MNFKMLVPSLIPLFVPVFLALFKPLVNKWLTEKKWWIPVAAPFLGAGLDALSYYVGTGSLGAQWGAVAGAAGVGFREIYDQMSGNAVKPA